ncbi:MAG TPA: HAD family hydrolase [Chloroflexota bacterium]|nr:HAD family hydrolase [Chloroflexota bacterium]
MGSGPDAAHAVSITFLLDVDNTLLDNDGLKDHIAREIVRLAGTASAARFWQMYEAVRSEEDYVDYPTTVRRWAEEVGNPILGRQVNDMLEQLPFTEYLYPHALETIAHLRTLGTVAILSDGDQEFQPLKIRRSGLAAAVEGRVMIFVHKENELPAVFARYPAGHYVAVDDKPRIVSALERLCPVTFTTVLVLQGRYAEAGPSNPPPDLIVSHIGDLRHFGREQFFAGTRVRGPVGD